MTFVIPKHGTTRLSLIESQPKKVVVAVVVVAVVVVDDDDVVYLQIPSLKVW